MLTHLLMNRIIFKEKDAYKIESFFNIMLRWEIKRIWFSITVFLSGISMSCIELYFNNHSFDDWQPYLKDVALLLIIANIIYFGIYLFEIYHKVYFGTFLDSTLVKTLFFVGLKVTVGAVIILTLGSICILR